MTAEATVVDQHALLEAPVTKETARPALEQLRSERIANRVTDSDFSRRSEYLLRVEAGEDVEAPTLYPTKEQQLEQGRDEAMAGANPAEYQLTYPPLFRLEGETLEFDTELRQFLSDAKVPAHLGAPIVERVESTIKRLGEMSPDDRDFQVEQFCGKLRERWGTDYKARTDAIADLLATASAKHERIGELIDAAPWLIADVAVAEWLWSVVEYNG